MYHHEFSVNILIELLASREKDRILEPCGCRYTTQWRQPFYHPKHIHTYTLSIYLSICIYIQETTTFPHVINLSNNFPVLRIYSYNSKRRFSYYLGGGGGGGGVAKGFFCCCCRYFGHCCSSSSTTYLAPYQTWSMTFAACIHKETFIKNEYIYICVCVCVKWLKIEWSVKQKNHLYEEYGVIYTGSFICSSK